MSGRMNWWRARMEVRMAQYGSESAFADLGSDSVTPSPGARPVDRSRPVQGKHDTAKPGPRPLTSEELRSMAERLRESKPKPQPGLTAEARDRIERQLRARRQAKRRRGEPPAQGTQRT
jgi:hypothetical protein